MKLRNLLYATMIACAFASCSNDNEEIPTPDGGEEANATLEVQIAAPATKALANGNVDTEKSISSLQLLVFNGTGDAAKLEAIGTVEGEAEAEGGSLKSVMTAITPGNKTVIVLANVDLAKISTALTASRDNGTSYSDFLNRTMEFANQETATKLTMNSKAFNVTVVASKVNYVGYGSEKSVAGFEAPIKLYRNVAKIALTKAVVSRNDLQYPNAAIVLKKAFILHAHKNTNLVGAGAAEWGAINLKGSYLNGSTDGDYKDWAAYMVSDPLAPFKKVMNFIPTVEGTLPYANNASFVETLSGAELQSKDTKYFYAYENTEANNTEGTDYCTLLVVEADFSYDNVSGGRTTESGRFYPIAVGYGTANFDNSDLDSFKALRSGTTLSGVLRNLQYNVSLTITGPGYKTPFGPKPDGDGGEDGDTFLDAQVEVVPFGTVTQNEEIE